MPPDTAPHRAPPRSIGPEARPRPGLRTAGSPSRNDRGSRAAITAALLGAMAVIPASAAAQGSALTQRVVISSQLQRLSTEGTGAGGSVDWIARRGSVVVDVGGRLAELSGVRWSYARLGAAFSTSPAQGFGAALDAGGGSSAGGEFGYLIVRVDARRRVGRRLWLELQNQFIDVEALRGNVVNLGALLADPRLTLGFGVHTSTGGNLEVRQVSARAEAPVGPLWLLGGIRAGRFLGPPTLAAARASSPLSLFAGCRFSVGGERSLMVILEADKLEGAWRNALTATFSLPL